MTTVDNLNVKVFADGADLDEIIKLAANPLIKGFTTNPTLMRMAGVDDYETFARQVLEQIIDRPVSFEVFADDQEGMLKQARAIASWGDNVNVKIPYTNTKNESMLPVIEELSHAGVSVNVTAMMTAEHVAKTAAVLNPDVPAIASVFAGRVADTGTDPVPMMQAAATALKDCPKAELLWASPREVLNIYHADQAGCHIITVTHDLLAKLANIGKDLDQFSLETVQMFYNDAEAAGYSIRTD